MQRPSESIDRILRGAGSDDDAKLVGEYIAALETRPDARPDQGVDEATTPKRRDPKPKVDYLKVASLWKDGGTSPEIATIQGIKANTAAARVRRARILFGSESVPNRNSGAVIGMNRRASSLDDIHAVGDTVHVSLDDIRTRQCLHQAALTRGFKISAKLNSNKSEWVATATELVTPLAIRRRKQ